MELSWSVLGPTWAVLRLSSALLERDWALLGRFGALLGCLGALWGRLGALLELSCGSTWRPPGFSSGPLGPSRGHTGCVGTLRGHTGCVGTLGTLLGRPGKGISGGSLASLAALFVRVRAPLSSAGSLVRRLGAFQEASEAVLEQFWRPLGLHWSVERLKGRGIQNTNKPERKSLIFASPNPVGALLRVHAGPS